MGIERLVPGTLLRGPALAQAPPAPHKFIHSPRTFPRDPQNRYEIVAEDVHLNDSPFGLPDVAHRQISFRVNGVEIAVVSGLSRDPETGDEERNAALLAVTSDHAVDRGAFTRVRVWEGNDGAAFTRHLAQALEVGAATNDHSLDLLARGERSYHLLGPNSNSVARQVLEGMGLRAAYVQRRAAAEATDLFVGRTWAIGEGEDVDAAPVQGPVESGRFADLVGLPDEALMKRFIPHAEVRDVEVRANNGAGVTVFSHHFNPSFLGSPSAQTPLDDGPRHKMEKMASLYIIPDPPLGVADLKGRLGVRGPTELHPVPVANMSRPQLPFSH